MTRTTDVFVNLLFVTPDVAACMTLHELDLRVGAWNRLGASTAGSSRSGSASLQGAALADLEQRLIPSVCVHCMIEQPS
jgi:hypothetical protein